MQRYVVEIIVVGLMVRKRMTERRRNRASVEMAQEKQSEQMELIDRIRALAGIGDTDDQIVQALADAISRGFREGSK